MKFVNGKKFRRLVFLNSRKFWLVALFLMGVAALGLGTFGYQISSTVGSNIGRTWPDSFYLRNESEITSRFVFTRVPLVVLAQCWVKQHRRALVGYHQWHPEKDNQAGCAATGKLFLA
jgi:hypothetical protein